MEETWRIILQEEYSGSGGGVATAAAPSAGGISQATRSAEEANKTIVGAKPYFQNAGKMAAVLVGSAGAIAFIIQMIRRSKVFSTFMDSFLTILSTVVDILMIPLIPILVPVLNLVAKLIPIAMEASKWLSEFFKNPVGKIKEAIAGIFEGAKNIGEWIGNMFKGVWEGLKNIVFTFWETIKTKAIEVWNSIGRLAGDVWNVIKTGAANVWTSVGTLAKGVWDTLKSGAENVWKNVTGFASNAWNTISTWFISKIINPIITILNKIPFVNIKPVSAQLGIPFVPKDMLAFVHRGEQIVPANRNISNRSTNITNIFNISSDVKEQAKRIASTLDDQMRSTSLSGW